MISWLLLREGWMIIVQRVHVIKRGWESVHTFTGILGNSKLRLFLMRLTDSDLHEVIGFLIRHFVFTLVLRLRMLVEKLSKNVCFWLRLIRILDCRVGCGIVHVTLLVFFYGHVGKWSSDGSFEHFGFTQTSFVTTGKHVRAEARRVVDGVFAGSTSCSSISCSQDFIRDPFTHQIVWILVCFAPGPCRVLLGLFLNHHFSSLLCLQLVCRPLLCIHLGLFSQHGVHLQCVDEEDGRRVMEEARPVGVVVAVELDQIAIASICVMELLCMVGLYEVILIGTREECRNEAFFNVLDRSQVINIKVSLTLDGLANECHSWWNEEARDLGVAFRQFINQGAQIREWAI